MKNLLFLAFAFACTGVFAQSFPMTGNAVVVTNTATVACSLQVKTSNNTVTVQAVVAKTSGTIAGTVTLQGSVDGVNYETVPVSLVAGGASTYTATDLALQAKTFVITGSPFLYYKLSYTGSGTMVGTLSGYVLPRNYQK